MKHADALVIAEWLVEEIRPFCERPPMIAGGIRRGKEEVHDMEIVAKPILRAPVPVFGSKVIDKTLLDRQLREMCDPLLGSCLQAVKGGEKFKQFEFTRWTEFGMNEPINPFKLNLFLVTPPAQWGVLLTIRTGPGAPDNNFSMWCVTQRSRGGALPDGYFVKDGAVHGNDAKHSIIPMPEEMDFLNFIELGWIEPKDRRAMWKR